MTMTPREAEAVCKAYREAEDTRERGAWERARLEAWASVSPYLGKGGPKSPKKWLPFPWEKSNYGENPGKHDNKAALALLKKLNSD